MCESMLMNILENRLNMYFRDTGSVTEKIIIIPKYSNKWIFENIKYPKGKRIPRRDKWIEQCVIIGHTEKVK